MKAQSKEGHINKGNIRKKSKDRVQQPEEKKKYSPQKHRKREGARKRKKQ